MIIAIEIEKKNTQQTSSFSFVFSLYARSFSPFADEITTWSSV